MSFHFSFLTDLATWQMSIKYSRKWQNITEMLHAVSSYKAEQINKSEIKYWRTVEAKVNGNTKSNHDCFTQTARTAISLDALKAAYGVCVSARAEGLEKQEANRNFTQS